MSETRRKPWFRLWDEMLTDPKMTQLNNSQVGIWCKLLCLANQQTIRGVISYEGDNFLRMLEKILATCRKNLKFTLEKFEDLGMIEIDFEEGYITITNWNKRQFASDDVTARVLKHKKRKRLRKRSTEQSRAEHKKQGASVPAEPSPQPLDEKEIKERIEILSADLKSTLVFPQATTFKDKMLKDGRHPRAVLRALEQCFHYKPKNPKKYCEKIVGDEDTNCHYQDAVAEHEKLKEDWKKPMRGGLM
jgi:hypothetical protein